MTDTELFDSAMARIENAIDEVYCTVCLDPDRIKPLESAVRETIRESQGALLEVLKAGVLAIEKTSPNPADQVPFSAFLDAAKSALAKAEAQ